MDVFEAVASRYSCRAFLPKPVAEKTVRDIVERAARAPSAGNMQPWRVYAIAGKRLGALKAAIFLKIFFADVCCKADYMRADPLLEVVTGIVGSPLQTAWSDRTDAG